MHFVGLFKWKKTQLNYLHSRMHDDYSYHLVDITLSLNRALKTTEHAKFPDFWCCLSILMVSILDSILKIGIFTASADSSLFNVWRSDLKFKWKQSTLLREIKKNQFITVHQYTSHWSVFPKRRTSIVCSKKNNVTCEQSNCSLWKSQKLQSYSVRCQARQQCLKCSVTAADTASQQQHTAFLVSKYIYGRALKAPWLLTWCFFSDNNVLLFTEEIHLHLPLYSMAIYQISYFF